MPEPTKIPRPFADSGDKNAIPDSSGSIGFASWQEGFPAITSEPFSQGGVAPKRADFNGIFNALSLATVWQQQGGFYAYDNTTDYEVGNVVEYSGDLYKCITANGPGSAVKDPTDATVWSKVMTAADTAAAYLPLSGGTLTGNLTVLQVLSFTSQSAVVNSGGADHYLRLGNGDGSTLYTNGASVYLYGASTTGETQGGFNIHAYDGANRKTLSGRPNGTLTWDSKNVAVVDDVDTTTSGYIRFTNGLQMVWGQTTIASGDDTTGVAVSYEKPFSYPPRVFTNVWFSSAYGYGMTVQATSRTTTGCQLIIGSSKGGTTQAWSNGNVIYLAIGPWA